MLCVFCFGREEFQYMGKKKIYQLDEELNSFVCSRCVQKLLQIPQEKLIKAHYLAFEKGYPEKAKYLEQLMEEKDGKQTRPGRHTAGIRGHGVSGSEQAESRLSQIQRKTPFSKNKHPEPDVSQERSVRISN